MTLYLWIHWFWVTALCDSGVIGDTTTIYSASSDISKLSEFKVLSTSSDNKRTVGNIFATPASYVSPSNGSLTIEVQRYTKFKLQKSNSKKYDGIQKVSIYANISEDNPLREVPVINLNVTKKFDDWSDRQIDANFGNMNLSNSDVTYFGNETSFNHSQLLNSEQIGMEETEKSSFSAAGITGISLGCVVVVGILCSISYFLYHNRGFNKPQVLNDHCSNHDSSGYLDDASVRDNSEEMYSLDNDSFLNSLEAMTIQNYWTDTVKHTKL